MTGIVVASGVGVGVAEVLELELELEEELVDVLGVGVGEGLVQALVSKLQAWSQVREPPLYPWVRQVFALRSVPSQSSAGDSTTELPQMFTLTSRLMLEMVLAEIKVVLKNKMRRGRTIRFIHVFWRYES